MMKIVMYDAHNVEEYSVQVVQEDINEYRIIAKGKEATQEYTTDDYDKANNLALAIFEKMKIDYRIKGMD